MIVQSAPPGEARFVMTMMQHTAFAGRLARAFGNDEFEAVTPREEMLHVVDHHDDGWAALDAEFRIDPDSGLPYHLVHTPLEEIVRTSAGSPALNEAHRPYCGLLSSMHSWGLYNGRYGLSDHVLIDRFDAAVRPRLKAMLDGELERQRRLKGSLATDPRATAWLDEAHIMQNYKQLQFFDTLSLYFHCTHASERRADSFPHVPKNAAVDVTVEIEPQDEGTYALAPFPFAEPVVELAFEGRYVTPAPQAGETDSRARIVGTPVSRQTITLVAAEARAG